MEHGLPEKVYKSLSRKVCENQNDLIIGLLKDTQIFDATQKKIQRSWAVPYIGWHPVNDRMSTQMPYDVTAMSWGRRPRREYGIPPNRKM